VFSDVGVDIFGLYVIFSNSIFRPLNEIRRIEFKVCFLKRDLF